IDRTLPEKRLCGCHSGVCLFTAVNNCRVSKSKQFLARVYVVGSNSDFEFVERQETEEPQEPVDVFVRRVAPILVQVENGGQRGIQENRSLLRLPHLLAIVPRNERECEAIGLTATQA